MSPRLAIVVGLLAGVATAALVLGGILVFLPDPAIRTAQESPSPSPGETASAAPGASATPTPSIGPVGSPVPSAGVSSPVVEAFGVGGPAPELVVPQVGGGTIDLANLRGRPVWVNFMGTYCPPCRDEFPLMNGFAARYAETGLVVVAIDVQEEEGQVAAFAQEFDTTFPLGLDVDGSAAERWGAAAALPVHFWIGADGIIRDGALGGIGPDIMAQGLETILPGVIVTP